MASFLLVLSILTLLMVLALSVEFSWGNRTLRFLKDLPNYKEEIAPKVSIIVAARNEEKKIRDGLTSLLNLIYPRFEIIAVDDRSEDKTGTLLDEAAKMDPRLHVLHIKSLPAGWLGKNYALAKGASEASGDLLLFTDADVLFHPDTLGKAVRELETKKLDHLTATPSITRSPLMIRFFIGIFSLFFGLFIKPWNVHKRKSKAHIGIGAFNLIRKRVYEAIGTHKEIRMRPDDDVKLGKLVKKNGFSQNVYFGRDVLRVEWYSSTRELINGMMKNAFPGTDYRVELVLVATVANLILHVWPFIAIFVTEGAVQLLNAAICGVILINYAINAHFSDVKPWYGLTLPFMTVFFLFIVWRSMILFFWNKGISWRGCHYNKVDLKNNVV